MENDTYTDPPEDAHLDLFMEDILSGGDTVDNEAWLEDPFIDPDELDDGPLYDYEADDDW